MNERSTDSPRTTTDTDGSAPRPVGVVLAGGRSSRLGIDKALLSDRAQTAHDSDAGPRQTLLVSAIERLLAVCEEVLVADRQRHLELFEYLAPRATSVADGPGEGPVAGILGAARKRPGASLLVLGCDLPNVPSALLEKLVTVSLQPVSIRGREPVLPHWTVARTGSGLEPLCAVYSSRALARLEERVAEKRFALYPLAEELEATVEVEVDQEALFNLNTAQDLERFALDRLACEERES